MIILSAGGNAKSRFQTFVRSFVHGAHRPVPFPHNRSEVADGRLNELVVGSGAAAAAAAAVSRKSLKVDTLILILEDDLRDVFPFCLLLLDLLFFEMGKMRCTSKARASYCPLAVVYH